MENPKDLLTERKQKYRAWDGQRMIYFDTLRIGLKEGHETNPYVYFENNTFDGKVKLTGHVDMEFTGLQDKNDTDVYEGDILKFRNATDGRKWEYGYVTFLDGSFIIKHPYMETVLSYWISAEDKEVVGDIFRNPELLEKCLPEEQ